MAEFTPRVPCSSDRLTTNRAKIAVVCQASHVSSRLTDSTLNRARAPSHVLHFCALRPIKPFRIAIFVSPSFVKSPIVFASPSSPPSSAFHAVRVRQPPDFPIHTYIYSLSLACAVTLLSLSLVRPLFPPLSFPFLSLSHVAFPSRIVK